MSGRERRKRKILGKGDVFTPTFFFFGVIVSVEFVPTIVSCCIASITIVLFFFNSVNLSSAVNSKKEKREKKSGRVPFFFFDVHRSRSNFGNHASIFFLFIITIIII